MRFLDVFAGIGGFRLGLTNTGHTPVGWIEKDKYARKAYEVMYDVEGEYTAKDVRKVNPEELPDFELLVGGFPCVSFSLSGKRKGFQDPRGTLFFEIVRIAKVKKPEYIFLENVRGLLSHDSGKTFATILDTLHDVGYEFVEWQMLNSKNFSKSSRPVPQNRERIFIIGHLRRRSGREVFPLRRENKGDLKKHTSGMSQGYRVYDPSGVSVTLAGNAGGVGAKTGLYIQKDKPQQFSTGGGIAHCIDKNYHKGIAPSQVGKGRRTQVVSNNISSNLTSTIYKNYDKVVKSIVKYNNTYNGLDIRETISRGLNKNQKQNTVITSIQNITAQSIIAKRGRYNENGEIEQNVEKRNDGNTNTITGVQKDNYLLEEIQPVITPDFKNKNMNKTSRIGSRNGNMFTIDGTSIHGVTDGIRIRRLTPKECWRLQGFPDRLFNKAKESGISNTQLYKMAGNAVTVNVIEAIGKRLKEIE